MTECSECDNEATRCFCEACIADLRDADERPPWQERYTEEQHERAIEILSEVEEIDCVLSDYDNGQIIVHTPYVSSEAVADVCRHFGLEIASFGPAWEQESEWPCMSSHGSTFQILLQYDYYSKDPIPLTVMFEGQYIDRLSENDKQF